MTESHQPKAESHQPEAKSHQPKAESHQPKAESQQPEAESQAGTKAQGQAGEQRQGAKVAEELEMVVWLEGHEPYVPEFCLNADQAMAKLGIKRSRLNQISGKELRVGRIKSGRYIKPMYRDQDIEAYLAWTRPTASHQASKKALQSVTDSLDAQMSAMTEQLEQQHAHTSGQYHQLRQTVAVEVTEWLAPILTNLNQQLAALKAELDVAQFERKHLQSQWGRQRKQDEATAEQHARQLMDMTRALELSQSSLNLAGRLESQSSFLTAQFQDVATSLKAHFAEQLAATNRQLTVLAEQHEQFTASSFPRMLRATAADQLDATIAQFDLYKGTQKIGQEGPQRLHQRETRSAATPRAARGAKRPYGTAIRRKPSLASHRG